MVCAVIRLGGRGGGGSGGAEKKTIRQRRRSSVLSSAASCELSATACKYDAVPRLTERQQLALLLQMTAEKRGIHHSDHLSGKPGKPGNVREFETRQGNVRDNVNSQGNVREKILSGKSVPKLFISR